MINNYTLLANMGMCFLGFIIGMLVFRLFMETRIRKSKLVSKQAYTDQLTGRGNRYMFLSILDKLIAKKKKFAVCFMDLDGFKQINDSMGHDAGDELLVALANAFELKLPKNATAYRLGGDEFAIVIEKIKTTEDVTNVLDDLKEYFKTPFIIDNTSISLQYSLGISMYPEDATTRQELVMYADDAMYYIKEHGKNDYYFHNKVLRTKIENKNKMQNDLKVAYENKQFGVDFQPRIDVNDTSKLCFEALLYWNHPVLGKITSAYFIKQADEMALTIKLDQYVLEETCKKLNYFKQNGHNNVKLSVNISNRHSYKKNFVDKLCNILNEYKVDPGDIQIELIDTIETTKIENYKLMFEKLKECGADIIVNNLEITYEAMNLYIDLPIDEVKLSSRYTFNDSNMENEVVENVINLCKALNYKVIMTKLETEKELNLAIKKGADKIQGNVLFKKMDDELIDEFLNEYSNYKNKIDNIILSARNMKNLI
mgnify:FL=1